MPVVPHPITVTLYDVDNTTAKASASVVVRNTSKGTTSAVATTNASGIAIIDLANLPLGTNQTLQYETGDKIVIVAYSGLSQDAATYTVAGNSYDVSLYLNPCGIGFSAAKFNAIVSVTTGNTTGTVAYAKILDFETGGLILHIETPANDTKNVFVSSFGYQTHPVIVREANTLFVNIINK